MPSTHENEARFFENSIISMAASDLRLGEGFEALLFGYVRTLRAMHEELLNLGLKRDQLDLDGLLPPSSHLIVGGNREDTPMELWTVERMGYNERMRLLRLGLTIAKDAPHCRALVNGIREDGSVLAYDPIVFCHEYHSWAPISPRYFRDINRPRRVNQFSGQTYLHHAVQSTIPAIPSVAATAYWGSRFCWGIRMSMPGAPAIRALTDPIGVKELLRMRDVP